eukprot:gene10845-22631_t
MPKSTNPISKSTKPIQSTNKSSTGGGLSTSEPTPKGPDSSKLTNLVTLEESDDDDEDQQLQDDEESSGKEDVASSINSESQDEGSNTDVANDPDYMEKVLCRVQASALLGNVNSFEVNSLGNERPGETFHEVIAEALASVGTYDPTVFDKDKRVILTHLYGIAELDKDDIVGPIIYVLANELYAVLMKGIDEGFIRHERVQTVDGVETVRFRFANGQTLSHVPGNLEDGREFTIRIFELIDCLVYYRSTPPKAQSSYYIGVNNLLGLTRDKFLEMCKSGDIVGGNRKRESRKPHRYVDQFVNPESMNTTPASQKQVKPSIEENLEAGQLVDEPIVSSSYSLGKGPVAKGRTSTQIGEKERGITSRIQDDPALQERSKKPINTLAIKDIPPLTITPQEKAITAPQKEKVKRKLSDMDISNLGVTELVTKYKKLRVRKAETQIELRRQKEKLLKFQSEHSKYQEDMERRLREMAVEIQRVRDSSDQGRIQSSINDEGPNAMDMADEIVDTEDQVVCAVNPLPLISPNSNVASVDETRLSVTTHSGVPGMGSMLPPVGGRSLPGILDEEKLSRMVVSVQDIKARNSYETLLVAGLNTVSHYDDRLLHRTPFVDSEENTYRSLLSKVSGSSVSERTEILIPHRILTEPYGPYRLARMFSYICMVDRVEITGGHPRFWHISYTGQMFGEMKLVDRTLDTTPVHDLTEMGTQIVRVPSYALIFRGKMGYGSSPNMDAFGETLSVRSMGTDPTPSPRGGVVDWDGIVFPKDRDTHNAVVESICFRRIASRDSSFRSCFLKPNGCTFLEPKEIIDKLRVKASYVSSRMRGNITSAGSGSVSIDQKPLERWSWVEKAPVFNDPTLLMSLLKGQMGIFDFTSTFGLDLLSTRTFPQTWYDAFAGRVVTEILDDVGTVFGIIYGHYMDSITATTVAKVKQLVLSLPPEFLYYRVSMSFSEFFRVMSEETDTIVQFNGMDYSKSHSDEVAGYLRALLEDTLSPENTNPNALTLYETNIKRMDAVVRMGDDSFINKPPQRKSKPIQKVARPVEVTIRPGTTPANKGKQTKEGINAQSNDQGICRRNFIFVHKIVTPSNEGREIQDCKNAKCQDFHH